MKWKKQFCRKLSGWLIAALLLTGLLPGQALAEDAAGGPAEEAAQESARAQAEDAAPPEGLVQVDETLYVNLDYYGNLQEANIVKGVSSSKSMEYTDHGSYEKVLNMSDETPLELTDTGVSFPLSGTGKKFFFQGQMDPEAIGLPWSLEVSYKLNGVPVEAEALAGAAGLVEIDVKAIPREDCSDYLKNNMLLAVMIPVDSKVYSIDAPGAQTQSIGNMSGIVFSALPGEEKEFTARLGTDKYESMGVTAMMMPASMDSFENISDIRELRDTWKEAGDAMYEGLDSTLSVISSFREEMQGLTESLGAAERARETVSSRRDAIFSTGDQALWELSDLGAEVQKLVPYLSTAKAELSQLHQDMQQVTEALSAMRSSLYELHRGLDRMENGLYAGGSDLSRISTLLDRLQDQTADYREAVDRLAKRLEELFSGLGDGSLWEELGLSGALLELSDLGYDMEEALSATPSEAFDPSILEELEDRLAESQRLSGQIGTEIGKLRETGKTARQIASASDALLSDTRRALSGGGKTAQGAKYTVDDLRRIIFSLESLQQTVDAFYPDMEGALAQTEALAGQTGDALGRTASALSLAQEALKASAEDADQALSAGIRSSLSMIDRSLGLFDALEEVQSAGSLAKAALDEETDRVEEETRLLEIDPKAEKESLTSSENKTPDSLQIILRTEEIQSEEEEPETLDAEGQAPKEGLVTRILNVFRKIFEAVRDIFAEA